MKNFINPKLAEELQLDRQSQSFWEKVFRFGIFYLIGITLIGSMAGLIFGRQGNMPNWAWVIGGPYLFFIFYCANFAVYKFGKSKAIKLACYIFTTGIIFILLIQVWFSL